jgi:chromosome segregation ATPase
VPLPLRVGGGVLLALLSGCRSVPSEKYDSCRKLNDTLRVENARLRDQTVALTTQNQDFSERAVDDARKIRSQEQAIAQLERSVHAYQAERDELELAIKQLKQAVSDSAPRLSSGSGRAAGSPADSEQSPPR